MKDTDTEDRRRSPGARGMIFLLPLAFILATGAAESEPKKPSGLEIMTEQRSRHLLKKEEEIQTLQIFSRAGEMRERRLVRYSTNRDDLYRFHLRLTWPADIEGTGLLIWERVKGNADQWLYLPAAGKIRRIPPGGKKNRFVGSDFTYQDLQPDNLSLHLYKRLRVEKIGEHDCFLIEALPVTPEEGRNSGYSKRLLWVRTDNFATVKVEYYDHGGKLRKRSSVRKLVRVKEMTWRADELEMEDVQAGTRSLFSIIKRRLNPQFSDRLFTESGLRRP